MAAVFTNALKKSKTFLKTGSTDPPLPKSTLPPDSKFTQAREATALFPAVSPEIDGEDCDHDCETCEVNYPRGWKIDEDDKLYGHINGWETHILVATGKTDWVRDVADEKDSVMEAVGKWKKEADGEPSNGKLMLSASDIPLPDEPPTTSTLSPRDKPTTILLLPAFTLIHNVTPALVPQLITDIIATAPTNTTPLDTSPTTPPAPHKTNGSTNPSPTTFAPSIPNLPTSPCPHPYLLLLCSQRTRDARCGQSAPLLKREFERHLRPLGLYRDIHDSRPGGVGIYFISHAGGHKYAANVMVYRRDAGQCVWLARVRPEHCEGIVRWTVLEGKVVAPERGLRGGVDRGRGVVSW